MSEQGWTGWVPVTRKHIGGAPIVMSWAYAPTRGECWARARSWIQAVYGNGKQMGRDQMRKHARCVRARVMIDDALAPPPERAGEEKR